MTTVLDLPACFDDTQSRTWAALFDAHVLRLNDIGCRAAVSGFERLRLDREIEDMRVLDDRLAALTGWRMEPVRGLMPSERFFAMLRNRRFPVAPELRSPDELEFCPRPDLFHDVVGHLPYFLDAEFAHFLQHLGEIAAEHVGDDDAVAALDRFFWFTAETGLVIEGGAVKVFGAAVLTSRNESAAALGADARHVPLETDAVFATPHDITELQPQYFVAGSYRELLGLVEDLPTRVRSLHDGLRSGV